MKWFFAIATLLSAAYASSFPNWSIDRFWCVAISFALFAAYAKFDKPRKRRE